MSAQIKVDYLIIDPQYDFHDVPDEFKAVRSIINGNSIERIEPALPVTGAWDDAQRIAAFISRVGSGLRSINVTMDSHAQYDIGHNMFWLNAKNENPSPFTPISVQDIENKVWFPVDSSKYSKVLTYAKALEAGGLYTIFIWPDHCLMGTVGWNVVTPIMDQMLKWEKDVVGRVDFFGKGQNPYTEHYGAYEAEVPEDNDETTRLNEDLLRVTADSDWVLVSGQALSHCVNRTATQLADHFGEENVKKMVLLEDTSSSVTGFEKDGQEFIKRMVARGMKVCKSTDIKFNGTNIIMPF